MAPEWKGRQRTARRLRAPKRLVDSFSALPAPRRVPAGRLASESTSAIAGHAPGPSLVFLTRSEPEQGNDRCQYQECVLGRLPTWPRFIQTGLSSGGRQADLLVRYRRTCKAP